MEIISVLGEKRIPKGMTRADCLDKHGKPKERPCPYIHCKHHLLYVVVGSNNRRILNRNFIVSDSEGKCRVELSGEFPTCSLDVADDGDHSLDEVGAAMGVSRQRAAQLEASALQKIGFGMRRKLKNDTAEFREVRRGNQRPEFWRDEFVVNDEDIKSRIKFPPIKTRSFAELSDEEKQSILNIDKELEKKKGYKPCQE